MPKFDVIIYAVVRVRICGVEADNHETAIAAAVESAELPARFHDRQDPTGVYQSYDEREVGYLVDPLRSGGQRDSSQSRYYLDAAYLAGITERLVAGHQLFFSPEYRAFLNRRKRRRKRMASS